MQKFFPTCLLAAALLSGCAGYTLGPAKPTAMTGVETLSVPVVENLTMLPRVEVLTTTSIIRELQLDGTYRITDGDKADATLYVTLNSVNRRPARSVRGNVLSTAEFLFEVDASYSLVRGANGQELMKGRAKGETNFFVTTEIPIDQQQAYSYVANQIAREITNQISEGW